MLSMERLMLSYKIQRIKVLLMRESDQRNKLLLMLIVVQGRTINLGILIRVRGMWLRLWLLNSQHTSYP
jgi:hypothetical protein